MRPRINKGLLDRLVRQVNELTGNPTTAWNVGDYNEETQSVPVTPNIGNYHVARVNGKYRIEQMQDHGTSTDALGSDLLSAREIEIQLRAYIAGLEASRVQA